MQGNTDKTIWRRIGLIAVLLPVCFFFPFALILVGFLAWTIYEDLKSPQHPHAPPPTWRDAKPEDSDWLTLFCNGCESPAEEQFLRAMVKEYNLKPNNGKLVSSKLTLEIQVVFANYRFDFLANGCQIIEIDGATYHSSPEQKKRDRIRDECSLQNGYKVFRIPASVVFNSPDEAVQRAKAVISETPTYNKPQNVKPAAQKRTITQHFNAFSEVLDSITRNVEIARLKQLTMADFKSAISTEHISLDALIQLVELDQQVDLMSPKVRKTYENLLVEIEFNKEDQSSLSEMYKWEIIVKPQAVNDPEIQLQIEMEYASVMEERNRRISNLNERCAKDPGFARLLCRKMEEAKYPMEDALKIVPMPRYSEYAQTPR